MRPIISRMRWTALLGVLVFSAVASRIASAQPADARDAAPTPYGVAPAMYEAPPANRPMSPVPLKPHEPPAAESGTRSGGWRSAAQVAASLAIVLGLFFAAAWAMRRASPHGQSLLPAEAFEILGRASLANRQQVQLLRCGGKLVLVSLGAAGQSARTLAEIADPAEVQRLVGLCRQSRPIGAAAGLRQGSQQAEGRHV